MSERRDEHVSVWFRRTTAERTARIWQKWEPVWDTDLNALFLGDGSTAGGRSISGTFYDSNGVAGFAIGAATTSAVNWLTATNAATGTGPILGAAGSDTNIPINISGKGTGALYLKVRQLTALFIQGVATAVNYLTITNSAAGNALDISATGTDSNISVTIKGKGSGTIGAYCQSVLSFLVNGVSSGINYLSVTGSATTDPVDISVAGTGTNVPLTIKALGTGSITFYVRALAALVVNNVASAVNWITATGSATGNNVTIGAAGSDTNVGITLTPKGTGAVAVAADDLEIGSKIVEPLAVHDVYIPVAATAANWPACFHTAQRAEKVTAVIERHSVAGVDGGAVTLMLKKVPSGTAPGSGTDCLAAGVDLKAVADTNQAPALHATPAQYTLAAGDSLAVVLTGTPTSCAGISVSVRLQAV